MTDFCPLQRAGTCDTNKGSWAGWWRGRGGMNALTHWADPHRLQVSPLQVSPLQVSPLQVSPLQVSPLQVSPLQVSPLQVSPSHFRLQASCNVGHCNFNVFIQHSPLNYIPYFNCNDCNCLNSTDSENTEVLPLTAVLVLPCGSGPWHGETGEVCGLILFAHGSGEWLHTQL